MIINIASTPTISGYTGRAQFGVASTSALAISKHITLEYSDKNIQADTLALGNIFTYAKFSSMTVTKGKEAAMQNLMKRWDDPKEVPRLSASIASEDLGFATGNTTVTYVGKVLL